jgi:PHD/YefM family antitoxin component YafN of YafNO toxin-antitoxin module
MNIVSTTSARETLDRILDEAVAAHEPVLTKGARSNGVLVAEEDWKAIQKTLTLLYARYTGVNPPRHAHLH